MRKQLIGLTGPSSFTEECISMIERYLNLNFVLLYHENKANIDYWLKECSAFILAGGVDIHPSVYEQNVVNFNNLSKFDIDRDYRELKILNYAFKEGKPVLGICRGHQLIGIYKGLKSSFCLDLTNSITVHQIAGKTGISLSKNEPAHCINLLNNFHISSCPERRVIKEIMEEKQHDKVWVNSFHHQGLIYDDKKMSYNELGIEILGVASAEVNKNQYKIIEMMRGKNWISCQFHPEYDYDVNSVSEEVIYLFKEMLKE